MTARYKYPRTHHLPWSESISTDDKRLSSDNIFLNKEVVVTEKMDGENTTLYRDYIHARSIDSKNHVSRDWIKNFWSQIRYMIPEDIRICGENLFAKHSIFYTNLESYFLGFSYWKNNLCYSWKDTQEIFTSLGIISVPVIYKGMYNKAEIHNLWKQSARDTESEGYVIRITEHFYISSFQNSVAKFVRKNHVLTDSHWISSSIIQNKLSKDQLVNTEV